MVQYEDALRSTLAYFGGDQIASDVFLGKYALRDMAGHLVEETPADMHRRLAKEFARIEGKFPNPMPASEIFDLLDGFRYVVPQGSPMSAIGNDYRIQSLSNCFVIAQPEDSYGGILFTDQEQAQIMKRRGGVGFDLSKIRPKGLPTANAAVTTDGIGVFMERFSNTCREVAQDGRRGALMLTIDIRHPEIETFIDIKRDLKKVTGANISIRLTDEFMRAVQDDLDFGLRWPIDGDADMGVLRTVRARDLWDKIIDSAWTMAEPGLLFWDTVRRLTPADIFAGEGFMSISTNPCGEIVLSAYDACRLLLLNLFSYVRNPFLPDASFDFGLFHDHVVRAQRLMDDIVELELEQIGKIIGKVKNDPESDHVKRVEIELWQKIRDTVAKGRRTGLGVTALGDALAGLGIRYGSDESIRMTETIYRTLALAAHESSVVMAKERGPFPVCDPKRMVGHPFIDRLVDGSPQWVNDMFMEYGRRNICLSTTAPAGSVSMLTQTTSGIEPAYMLKYRRRKKINSNEGVVQVDFEDEMGDRWQEYDVYHHGFQKWMDVTGKSYDDVESSPYFNATSADVDWIASVDIQAAAQKWVEHSISKTCNLPADATKELVAQVYMRAWEKGCKGFTVYRDGCRQGVLVQEKPKFQQYKAPKRPQELSCNIHHVQVRGETWTILVGLMEGKPYEVFGGLSKYVVIPKKYTKGTIIKHDRKTMNSVYDLRIENGDDLVIKDIANQFDNPNYSHATRLISLALRHGAKIQYVVEQLSKEKDADMFSFTKCIARVLKSYIEDGTATTMYKQCEQCGGTKFAYQEGCIACTSCGWSKCS